MSSFQSKLKFGGEALDRVPVNILHASVGATSVRNSGTHDAEHAQLLSFPFYYQLVGDYQ
jgi:hypothetical protein